MSPPTDEDAGDSRADDAEAQRAEDAEDADAPRAEPERGVRAVRAADASVSTERTRRNFILGLIALFALLSFLIFQPFLSYVFMGLLFVYLVYPSYRFVKDVIGLPRISAVIVILLSFVVIVAPLTWVAFEVVQTTMDAASGLQGMQAEDVSRIADDLVERAYELVGLSPPDGPGVGEQILTGVLARIGQFAQESARAALEFAGAVTIGLVVMLFVLYYGLVDGHRFVDFLRDVSPLSSDLNDELLAEIKRTVDAVFLGHVIVSVVQGLVGGIGFLIFGLPNPIFWGFIMIIMSLIPVLGAFLVWVPAAIYLFAQGNTFGAVGLALWGFLFVSTIDNVIRPKIVGSRADIHPVLVLVGVLGGLAAFGVIGLVLGPLVLALFIAVVNFWRRDYFPKYGDRAHAGDAPPRDSDAGALTETLDS